MKNLALFFVCLISSVLSSESAQSAESALSSESNSEHDETDSQAAAAGFHAWKVKWLKIHRSLALLNYL